jgi:hypothetical protein
MFGRHHQRRAVVVRAQVRVGAAIQQQARLWGGKYGKANQITFASNGRICEIADVVSGP